MMDLAVVICTYDKREFVVNCIESVLGSTFKNFDLIVVDNASVDDTVPVIQEKYSEKLTLLVNPENLGGSGGFNRGMQHAMDKNQYKYILLLDNDVVVEYSAIEMLYSFMEEHPEAGACGSLVCKMSDPEIIQDFGAMIEPENLGVRPLYGNQKRSEELPEVVVCDYVAACSAIYRVDVLKKTGVINKDLFIYWDDMELSWKIRLAGYKVFAYSRSVVWHNHGLPGSLQESTFGSYYFFRNKLYCFTKYLDDIAYTRFVDDVTTRMFRIISVNRDKPELVFSYMHALYDVLNGTMRKADNYKIRQYSHVPEKFHRTFETKKSVLIDHKVRFNYFRGLIDEIRKAGNNGGPEITVTGNLEDAPRVEGVNYCEVIGDTKYDAVIEICDNIMDLEYLDRDKYYIDKYFNSILDESDFRYFEGIEGSFSTFHRMTYAFLNSKFDALRAILRS